MDELQWVASTGGPLLCLSRDRLGDWDGSLRPRPRRIIEATFRWRRDGVATDYDRACDVRDYLGVIPVGDGQGLILGDVPSPTTWWPAPPLGYFVRWISAPSDEEVMLAMTELAAIGEWIAGPVWRHSAETFELFDAACDGTICGCEHVSVAWPAGSYQTSWARYQPTDEVELLLIRFEPVS